MQLDHILFRMMPVQFEVTAKLICRQEVMLIHFLSDKILSLSLFLSLSCVLSGEGDGF